MSKILLSNSDFDVFIDEEDYDLVNQYKWHLTPSGYIMNGKELIHRVIMSAKKGFDVDHIDGNPLNNKKENLRICSHGENCRNQKKSKNNTSGYKGVSWRKDAKKYRAYIMKDQKEIHLGYFNSKKEAAKIYNIAALQYFGPFAKLNKIFS
jgi:hypothetical protein